MKTLSITITLLMLTSANSYALVGDEQCISFAEYNEERSFGRNDRPAGWNCNYPGSNDMYGSAQCRRIVKTCIEYGPSPSEHQAKLIGEAVSAQLYEGAKKSIDVNMDSMRKEVTALQAEVHRLTEALSKNPESLFKKRK